MKFASQARSRVFVILALLFSLGVATAPALAKDGLVVQAALPSADGDRVVQDDPDNPIKFSIDPAIANGSVSTQDLYIGTVESYLGTRLTGRRPSSEEGFGVHPYDILIMNDRVGIVLAAGTDDPWGYPGGSILDAGRVTVPGGSTDLKSATFGNDTRADGSVPLQHLGRVGPVECRHGLFRPGQLQLRDQGDRRRQRHAGGAGRRGSSTSPTTSTASPPPATST